MNRRLKILHFPAAFPDPDYGQPYSSIFIWEHILSNKAFNDHAVIYKSSQQPRLGKFKDISKENNRGIEIIRIHQRRHSNIHLNRLLVYGRLSFEVFRLLVKGLNPDIIHAHYFMSAKFPLMVAKILKIPFVVTEHWNALFEEGMLPKNRLEEARKIFDNADLVLPVSEHLVEGIKKLTGAKIKKYQVIHNTVDTSVFHPSDDENTRLIDHLLFVGRNSEEKDLPNLLQALTILKNKAYHFHLDIIGRGDWNVTQILANQLGIGNKITIYGEQSKAFIAEKMRNATLLILSSTSENSPCVIGEALCCGLPVVGTSVGGVPELINKDAYGRLAPPEDPQALAAAVMGILDHPERYNRLLIAEENQSRFSYEAIGKQLDDAYRKLIN